MPHPHDAVSIFSSKLFPFFAKGKFYFPKKNSENIKSFFKKFLQSWTKDEELLKNALAKLLRIASSHFKIPVTPTTTLYMKQGISTLHPLHLLMKWGIFNIARPIR